MAARSDEDSVWSQPLGVSLATIDKQKKGWTGCSVWNCNHNSVNNPDLAYFRLPLNKQRALMWLEKIQQVKHISKKILVCEKHFEPRYVNRNNESRTRLVMHAVPTLHLPRTVALECTPDVAATGAAAGAGAVRRNPWALAEDKRKLKKPIYRVTQKRAVQQIESYVHTFINQSHPNGKYSKNSHRNIAEIIKLHRRLREPLEGWKFTDEFKFFALKLYFSSPNTYKTMRPLLSLPTISMLYRLYIPSSTTVCENLIIALKIKVDTMTVEQRECAVCIGTLDLKEHLHYDVKQDQIIGFHDVDGAQRLEPAKTALVVMVRGIYDAWKQAVSFSFLAQHQDYADVREYILNIINRMFDIGLTVRVLISDIETDFIGLSREKRINSKDPHFHLNNHKVYYMYDPAHLMKNVREHFTTNNFYFNGMIAKWEHITACYDHECEKPLRLAPKLTCYHIIHTHLQSEKDKVKLAAEVFSKTTAAAVSAYADLKVVDEPANGTVEWIMFMNKLFNMLNFTSFNFNDETKIPFSGTDAQLEFITEVLKIFKDLRLVDVHRGSDATHNAKFINRLRATLKVIVSLYQDLNIVYYKFPTFLSRDCLDTFFDTVRQQYGRLPTCRQIQLSMTKIPIFNTFQRNKSKWTDNLENFLDEAIAFSEIVMVQEQAEPKGRHSKHGYFEATAGIDVNALELPEEYPLQHLAAYLLYEGYKEHSDCEATKCYAFQNSDSITVILTLKSKSQNDNTVIVMVPTEFVEFVESMELTLKLYFETDYQRNALSGLMEHLFSENITFSMPCDCFPLDYIKCLYMRYRFNLIINYNNEKFEKNSEESGKYFAVNDIM